MEGVGPSEAACFRADVDPSDGLKPGWERVGEGSLDALVEVTVEPDIILLCLHLSHEEDEELFTEAHDEHIHDGAAVGVTFRRTILPRCDADCSGGTNGASRPAALGSVGWRVSSDAPPLALRDGKRARAAEGVPPAEMRNHWTNALADSSWNLRTMTSMRGA